MLTNNPSLRNKSLRARMKVAHVEFFRDVRLAPRYAVTATNANQKRKKKKISAQRKKRAKPRNDYITQYRMRYAIHIPLNAKDLAADLAMHSYGT